MARFIDNSRELVKVSSIDRYRCRLGYVQLQMATSYFQRRF